MTTLDNGFLTPEEVAQSLLFSEVQRGLIGDTIHLVAANLELTKEYFKDVNVHYIIHADTIHLRENLEIPGRNVALNARIISSDSQITINTSYTKVPVEDYENNPAKSGTVKPNKGANGEDGAHGKDGGHGIAGGHIVLVAERYELGGELRLIASGGPGGRGQHGGDGAAGTDGEAGKDAEVGFFWNDDPTAGKNAGDGGNGGNAGKSGNGGNGGDILVGYVESAREDLITLYSEAGQAGADAEPGSGKSGGKGGLGGRIIKYGPGRGDRAPVPYISNERTYSGTDGKSGHDGARAASAVPGKAGQLEKMLIEHAQFHGSPIEHGSVKEEFIKFYQQGILCASLEQQMLTIHKASVAYMAGSEESLTEAAVLLTWLIHTLPDEGWFDQMRARQVQTTAFMEQLFTDSVQWLALRSKAVILLAQLGQGLDYFGNPWNWTPLMPLNEYQKRGSDLITAAKQAEDLYIEYMQAQNNQQNREGTLKKALSITADNIVLMEDDRAKSITARSELKTEMDSMLSNLSEKENELAKSANEFVEALKMQLALDSLKATFDLVVNGVALVTNVTPAITALRAGGAIYSAVNSYFESESKAADSGTSTELTDKEKKKKEAALSKSMDNVKKVFSSGYAIYQSGSELIDIAKQMEQARDKFGYRASMVTMTREEFESMLEPVYKKVSKEKVENYRKAFYDYLNVVESYQGKVQTYNAKFLEEEKLLADATRLRAEDERLRQALGKQVDPSLPLFHTYIFSMYNDAKQNLIDFLYQEYQAFRYMVLGHDLFPQIRGSHVAELSQIHATITNKIIEAVNHSETPIQTYRNITVILNEATYPEQFRALREHKQAFFALSLDNKAVREKIAGKAHMTASQCQVQLPGARLDSGNVHVRFAHMGSSTFLDPQGERFDFVHKKSKGFYEYQVSITPAGPQGGVTEKIESYSGGSAGDGLGRIMPGLLALWSIEVPLADLNNDPLNSGVDLKDVTKIVMTFDGTAVAYTDRKPLRGTSKPARDEKDITALGEQVYDADAVTAPGTEGAENIIIEL